MLLMIGRLSIDLFLTITAILLLWYWVPLLAVLFSGAHPHPAPEAMDASVPRLVILAPCFNGEDCLPAFMKCMLSQNYPRDRYRVFIIADNCTDDSARRARELGADAVYVRDNPRLRGKGYALDEYLQDQLRHEPFDRLLLFDIDAQVDNGYLRKAASIGPGPAVVQGSTVSKNPDESIWAGIGDRIQALLRVYQDGRSRLGLPPLLIGSHGICIDRDILERLDWRIAPYGSTGDDLELELRCLLRGVPILYAPDLQVINDLPAQGHAIRRQRRRWTRSVLHLAPHYSGPFLRRILQGDGKAVDALVGILALPSFSNLFLLLTATSIGLWAASAQLSFLHCEARLASALWTGDVLYLAAALWRGGARLKWTDAFGMPCYLAIRALALMESFILIRSREWWPTPHFGNKAARLQESSEKGGSGD